MSHSSLEGRIVFIELRCGDAGDPGGDSLLGEVGPVVFHNDRINTFLT